MKATLEFNLPEERHEHSEAINGTSFACALRSVDQKLRDLAKYKNKSVVKIDDVRAWLREETDGQPWLWE